jgi:hypothetical protein
MKAYARIRTIGILALFVLLGHGLAQAAQAEGGGCPRFLSKFPLV